MTDRTPEEIAVELSQLVRELVAAGRNDLLLRAIGVSVLEELRIEAAKSRLSRLLVTKDYRIILVDYGNKEVEMTPVHKAVYLLFLNHPEGIEFKKLCEYRNELLGYYMATAKLMDKQTIAESVDMLVDPLNNSINEKCSRIKSIFLNIMDLYTANYYIISGHTQKHFAGSSKIWYERLKNVKIPRELVIREDKQV
ncbi:hypothetical protein SAMN04487901_11335 [Prevotella communis]|jgi:hypothetical protein|uniref:Uncharacterized protein n=1 Tax=Prevotella communis TaxID=2913614 RepID=A0A1H0K0F1_9BACT|nr:hypothetical protein [Prevotella communis]UKK61686.1 hypothetical protein L6468_11950 [Prevotella communis]UKK64512.1 hypothetical protein L6473_11955 [Prevotella communis]SDG94122.1 hypothetical protein SAMN04487901_11335 [Prevotella communis]SDO49213.1 hypothetical protein SAMN04487900_12243 [Prevotella communis]